MYVVDGHLLPGHISEEHEVAVLVLVGDGVAVLIGGEGAGEEGVERVPEAPVPLVHPEVELPEVRRAVHADLDVQATSRVGLLGCLLEGVPPVRPHRRPPNHLRPGEEELIDSGQPSCACVGALNISDAGSACVVVMTGRGAGGVSLLSGSGGALVVVSGGPRVLALGVVKRALGAYGGRRLLLRPAVAVVAGGSRQAEAELGRAEVLGVDLHGRLVVLLEAEDGRRCEEEEGRVGMR
jgi:hypothetical protein